MVYLNLPISGAHGWGVCGKYLARHLSEMTPTRLLTERLTLPAIGDELELASLQRLLPPPDEIQRIDLSKPFTLDAPLLKPAERQLMPWMPNLKGTRTIGYTFFETTRIRPEHVAYAREHYDVLVAGSSWCEALMREAGLTNVSTILQGIDPSIFFPEDRQRQFLRDRFVVFTGGKFELRKGHDIVIRAFKVLQDRHRDVMLVYAWNNAWAGSFETMRVSPHIRFDTATPNTPVGILKVLAGNGIDIERTIAIGPRAQFAMPQVYRNTDVGLFPNRAEGGTNLVLMEYMACGKPVIASDGTGHADIITPANALPIKQPTRFIVKDEEGIVTDWPEPDLEQTVEQLEFAYQNRDRLREIGRHGAADMAKLTWRRTSEQFHQLLTSAA